MSENKGFEKFLKKLDDSANEAITDPDIIQGEIEDVMREAYDLLGGMNSGISSPMGIPPGHMFDFGEMGAEPIDMLRRDPLQGLDYDALRRQVLKTLEALESDVEDTGWQTGGGPGHRWKSRRITIRRSDLPKDGNSK